MKNVCKNCTYFIKHYRKDEFGRYVLIEGLGHCKNTNLTYRASNKILKTGAPCDFFQPEEVNPELVKNDALEKLRHAELLIHDVKRIIKGDIT